MTTADLSSKPRRDKRLEVYGPEGQKFCVYLHKRPDGSVFYVGKGTHYRAHDFAPRRRTQYHKNITAKHGRENIVIDVLWCDSEDAAFSLERELIAKHQADGLANMTEGGEGASGRKLTLEQRAALSEAVKRGWDSRGRKPAKTPRTLETATCKHCGAQFSRMSSRKVFCDEKCGQRHARAKAASKPAATYKTNTSGRTGIYATPYGKWNAQIGVDKKLRYLGTFDTREAAISARERAEKELGRRHG